jgi:cytochrome c biogenesis protein CcmG, thiol:disulfide interchange protein DsbE
MNRLIMLVVAAVALLTGVAEARAPRIGEQVPSIRLPNLIGKLVDTGQLKGKTLVIYFWNNQCGCTEQLIQLRSFITGLKGKPFAFITVNEGQGKAIAEGFIKTNGLPYEVLLDAQAAVGKKDFGVKVLPTIYVIGKDGVLREKLIGVVDFKRLQAIITRHL